LPDAEKAEFMVTKKAVDVVLLPDEAMTETAIKANAGLVEKFGAKIVLHKENCLPHVSLAMGCINELDIPAIERVLTIAAERCAVHELKVIGIHTSVNLRGETVSVFELEKAAELQSLHEDVMGKTAPYLSYEVTEDMIFGDEQVAETTLLWIKNYPEKASFANFFPHITIGYGEVENQPFPIEFRTPRLALCHLGNHCTCRKILTSVELLRT
jgi:2'-5' RNA ligase